MTEREKAVAKWRKEAKAAQLRAKLEPTTENMAAVHAHLLVARMLGEAVA